jgi:quercetin dioxygenase-like cupin family protein
MTKGALSRAHGLIRQLGPPRLVDSARLSAAGRSMRTGSSSLLQYVDQGYLGPVRVLSAAQCRGFMVRVNGTSRHPPLDWSKGHGASSRVFYELASHPTIVAIVTALLGDDVMLWGASIESRRAGEVHPWHTDIESAASHGTALSVWIGLQHTSRDSSLTLVPYSHRFGATVQEVRDRHGKRRADTTAADIAGWAQNLSPRASVLQPDMADGEALFFDGRLWHGSSNGSGRTRRAVLLQYATPDTAIRIPDFNYLDWPFRRLNTPRPACVMISGRGGPMNNRIVPAPLPEATLTTARLSNRIYPLRVPLDIDEGTRWKPYDVFRGGTANVADLSCHASVLIHGHSPHPPHRHEEEEILILLSGEADLLLPDRRMRLKAGQLVYYPAQFAHTLQTTSDAPASYLMFKWRNVAAAATDSLLTFRHARPFEDASDLTIGEGFSVRGLFRGPTTSLRKLECHVSKLPPGAGYEPHVDAHDVAIVLLDGQIETLAERVGAHAVVFHPAGEAHGLRNPGDIDALYLVIEFHGPRTAHLSKASVGAVSFSRLTDPERWKRKIKHVWRRLRHGTI